MGMSEDDRIRRKNREYNQLETAIPIIYPIGGSYDEKNADVSDGDSFGDAPAGEGSRVSHPYYRGD